MKEITITVNTVDLHSHSSMEELVSYLSGLKNISYYCYNFNANQETYEIMVRGE